MQKRLITSVLVLSLAFSSQVVTMAKTDNVNTSVSNAVDEGVPMPGDKYTFEVGNKTYYVNDTKTSMQMAPVLIKGKIYLPVKHVVANVLKGTWSAGDSISIKRDNNMLTMQVGSANATLNGTPVTLSAPLAMVKGNTYMPYDVLNYFGITTTTVGMKAVITLPGTGINHKPIADFDFNDKTMAAKLPFAVTLKCYDPDAGQEITDYEWSVEGDKFTKKTGRDLSVIIPSPTTGTYTVGLHVKDQYGLWSDWVYKKITVVSNKTPIIKEFKTDKTSYKQGEKIEYSSVIDNEAHDEIKTEKWSYRLESQPVSEAKKVKPDTLYEAGKYIITYQVTDSAGNESREVQTEITVTNEKVHSDFTYNFGSYKIGEVFDNQGAVNYRTFEDTHVLDMQHVKGKLIMSDSPEEVTREGIMYRDTISGQGRLIFHHINAFKNVSSANRKRLVIVVQNKESRNVTLTINNEAIKGPVDDVVSLGQKTLYDYFKGSKTRTITLKPGEKTYLYDSKTAWRENTCISGLVDVNTSGKVQFTFATVTQSTTLTTMDNMELFYKSVHPRGTYDEIGINYSVSVPGGKPTKLILGKDDDEWVKGHDALLESSIVNKGNYGVLYKIKITATEDTGVFLNPRASVFKGAVKWTGQGVYNIPTSQGIQSDINKAACLGIVRAGQTKTLEYMLPNGSAAPVLIGFVPASCWIPQ